jgi:regulator of sirC expression with transglutaminase-like and TPR domain/5-hydroxyisourate hydrolase-like protein (transthyretin family)
LRRFAVITFALLSLLVALCATAQMRGTGRLQGNVFDKNTGKPIAGATITINTPAGNTRPIVTKTDAKGHWAAIGMTPGQWNVDISAPGYVTSRGTANVSEVTTAPPIKIELEPEAKQEPAPVAAPAGPTVPKEAVDAIKEGQELLRLNAGDVVTNTQATSAGSATAISHAVTAEEVKENAKRAVADFEKALPMIPEDSPELRDVKNQVLGVLAQAYYRAGDVKNAIATLEKLNAIDPATATRDAAHTTRDVLLANLYLENNQLEEGRALLEKLPPAAISDPTAYINIGILFLNKKKPADAVTYFTKAIEMNGKSADGYYYRGLAEVQLNRYAAAKADFQQVLALSPDSPEARDAKQMLASLK